MSIDRALREAVEHFPNCRIANCSCDSKAGKWQKGCCCFCHFAAMDALRGKDKWSLVDFDRQAKKGLA